MRAVVVSFDHLPVGFLGCYGNTWVDTPNLDRLAAEAVLFDAHFAECLGPAESHAWWTACRQFPASAGATRGADVVDRLREAEVRTTLLVEQPNGRPVPTSEAFDEIAFVAGEDGLDADVDSTPFARLVAEAVRRVRDGEDGNALLWLKSRGVPSPWLPPREFAERYVALFEDLEDDAEPAGGPTNDDEFEWVALDEAFEDDDADSDADDSDELDELDEEFDERDSDGADEIEEEDLDEREEFDALLTALATVGERENNDVLDTSDWLLVRAVYGGYVALLDRSLGLLRSAIAECWGSDVLLIVTAAEGESLGERVGFPAGPGTLGEERFHTPLLVAGTGMQPGMRCHRLVQPMDVAASLLDWFGLPDAVTSSEGRSLLPAVRGESEASDDEERMIVYGVRSAGDAPPAGAIRSPRRLLTTRDADAVRDADPRGDDVQVFVKPGDVWEVHDVSNQSTDEARELAASLAGFLELARTTCPVEPPKHV